MNKKKRLEILKNAKAFFKNNIVEKHIKNTEKLKEVKEFKINPFLVNYLANFAFGNTSKESIAKALIYPRILGTSINTIFGNEFQEFCCKELKKAKPSLVTGIDIEFKDAKDKRIKYCQLKAGPNTINYDDVEPIKKKFEHIKSRARKNKLSNFDASKDCIVGVLYGTEKELSQFYKTIKEEYPVIIGQDFWHRLTGDKNFYNDLIEAFVSIADEVDSTDLINEVITELSEQL